MECKSKIILAFDANLKLVGIFGSYYTAAKMVNTSHQMIIKACRGDIVSAKKFYWREADDVQEYIYDCDDIGVLTLLEFDQLHGLDRKIYATNKMKKNEIVTPDKRKFSKHGSNNNKD